MGSVFVKGVKKGTPDFQLKRIIQEEFIDATDDMSWLKPGEFVLLKPALNSPDPYPATCHPLALSAVAEVLKDRGAKVFVGDQSGIEHVVQGPQGVVKGSSKDLYQGSGMADCGLAFRGFEEDGWGRGFFHFPKAPSWNDGFYMTNMIQRVHHIINLPRLSTHIQSGVTLGFKNLTGMLREDSRMEFHADGPFNYFVKACAGKARMKHVFNDEHKFFEKMVEISLAVKDKLRCTLFSGTKAQVTFGPDARMMNFKSYVVEPDNGLIIASQDQVSAEAVALAFLTHLYKNIPKTERFKQRLLIKMNRQIKELGTERVWDNKFIAHAMKLGLSDNRIDIVDENVPPELRKELDTLLS